MSDFIGTKLTMNLGERSYDIILKNGALENLYQFARLDRKVAVVTDSGVPAQYAQRVADQCRDAVIITVPQGEASKSFKILETVLKQMLDFHMGRGDLVVAVGGGVVGDLAGFAASIYMRGIDFINCPTTTLSMIDSSIGGKTAVDLGDTKNIVGAFWQPKLVIGGSAGCFLGEYQAGGTIIVLGLGCEKGKAPVGSFCGTGMHGGKMFIRSAAAPTGLPEQVSCRVASDGGQG